MSTEINHAFIKIWKFMFAEKKERKNNNRKLSPSSQI